MNINSHSRSDNIINGKFYNADLLDVLQPVNDNEEEEIEETEND